MVKKINGRGEEKEITGKEGKAASEDNTGNPPVLTLDYDLYAQYLEDSDFSDEQKRKFMEILWSIVVTFVDLGFGIHPVQQVCEQELEIGDFIESKGEDMLKSEKFSVNKLNNATDGQSDQS